MAAWPRYKRWRGFLNMGRPRVPPLPAWVKMTDRATDTEYYLTQEGTSPALTLLLTTTVPGDRNRREYFKYTGPYTPDGNWKLYIENGVLSAEAAPAPSFVRNRDPQTFTRRAYESTLLRVDVDDDGVVSTTEVEI